MWKPNRSLSPHHAITANAPVATCTALYPAKPDKLLLQLPFYYLPFERLYLLQSKWNAPPTSHPNFGQMLVFVGIAGIAFRKAP